MNGGAPGTLRGRRGSRGDAGQGLYSPEGVWETVKEGPERLRELMQIGVAFTTKDGQLDLGREGGHSTNRIVHAKDLSGKEIERALLHSVAKNPNISTFENHVAVELLTEHHTVRKRVIDRSITNCWGAFVLNEKEHRVDTFLARVVMLSTGGLGHVYLHTTNPPPS